MSIFASEPMSIEEKEAPAKVELPGDVQNVLSLLERDDINTFVFEYIKLLQKDNANLISFLNQKFNRQDKNVFEFLFNMFKANSNEDWSVKTFFITIMNLGLSIGENGTTNFYYYVLLTDKDTPSPIYGVAQYFNKNQRDDINSNFIQFWNSLFQKETFENTQEKTFMVKLPPLSKNSRYTIILTVISLLIILALCGVYFFNKYKVNPITTDF